jgi:protein-tyrosine phosphatase
MKAYNGKHIKDNKIFRSTAFFDTSKEDMNKVSALHIDSVFDLRDPDDPKLHLEEIIPNAKYYVTGVISSLGKQTIHSAVDASTTTLAGKNMSRHEYKICYQDFLHSYEIMPLSKGGFLPIFEAMNRHETILIHCNGGKDRTGVACMMIELALGVSKNRVIYDYWLSNIYRRKRNLNRLNTMWKATHKLVSLHYMWKTLDCRPKHIKLSMKTIFKDGGNIESFLLKTYGITSKQIEDWRSYYLD